MLNVKVIIYLLCEKNSNYLGGVVMWRKVVAMGVSSCSKPTCANGKDMFLLFLWEFFPCVFGCKFQMQLPEVINGSP
jgi:hypothetical protein